MAGLLQIAHELIYALPKPGARSHERKGVQPQGNVLYRCVVAFKDLQRLTERMAGAHIVLLERDYREVLPAGDAGYETVVAVLAVDVPDYHRSGILRAVGIPDVERYPLFAHWLHRLLMQHRRAHEGKLAKLGIGYLLDRLRVINNARVRHKYAGDIRPVLVHIGVNCNRREGAGYVAAAAGHYLYLARAHTPVKAGDDYPAVLLCGFGNKGIAAFIVYAAVKGKNHAVGRVDKGVAQIFGHELRGEILTARHEEVNGRVFAQRALKLLKLGLDIIAQSKLVAYLGKALLDGIEDIAA